MDFINQAKKLADTVRDIQQAATNAGNSIDEAINGVKNTAAEITASGVAKVNELNKLSTTATQQGFEAIQNASKAFDDVKATATGFATSGMIVADALKDLPKTAEQLAKEMPKIAYRLKHGAGIRVGDSPRSNADIMKLFDLSERATCCDQPFGTLTSSETSKSPNTAAHEHVAALSRAFAKFDIDMSDAKKDIGWSQIGRAHV